MTMNLNFDEDSESGIDDADAEDLGDLPDDMFPFRLGERPLIQGIISALRDSLGTCDPLTLQSLSKALFALERLPWSSKGIHFDLSFEVKGGEQSTYICGVELDPREFRLYRGSVFDLNGFLESDVSTVFTAWSIGSRDGSTESFSDWLDDFNGPVESLKISDYDEAPIPDLPPPSEDGWSRLKKYWDLNDDWEDD